MSGILSGTTAQVFRVTGSRKGAMGTAFVVHRDRQYLYLVTCYHVIIDITNNVNDPIAVNGKKVDVIERCLSKFDLVVLRMTNDQLEATPLPARVMGRSGMTFRSAGFYRQTDYVLTQNILGKLQKAEQIYCELTGSQVTAWRIELTDEFRLEDGHSGAPVLNEEGIVIAVITMLEDEGRRGLALSIEALQYVWPDMPTALFAEPKHIPVARSVHEPLMNCEKEMSTFYALLEGAKNPIRAIVVQGEHGCGKTRLLNEFHRVASEQNRIVVYFDLRQHQTLERCLERIADKIAQYDSFSKFHQSLREEKPDGSSKQREWERKLTLSFFYDLRELPTLVEPFIIFDNFEKADSTLRVWFLDEFITRLEEKPLVVVVAGHSDLDSIKELGWVRFFKPRIPSIKYFYEYAQICGVQIDRDSMNVLYAAFQTTPKSFVDYVNILRLQQQGTSI